MACVRSERVEVKIAGAASGRARLAAGFLGKAPVSVLKCSPPAVQIISSPQLPQGIDAPRMRGLRVYPEQRRQPAESAALRAPHAVANESGASGGTGVFVLPGATDTPEYSAA